MGNYILPIGNSVAGPLSAAVPGYGAGNSSNTMGTGIYGASYFAAAGLYKNLGYLPKGYDGIDNDWQRADRRMVRRGLDDNNANQVHRQPPSSTQHNTARSETLYAILVEGVGPLGSVFSRDDFSDREVKDTDGDGLPEFVDAWGQPLQFFRWPLLYHTDTQKGQVIDYFDYTQTPPASSADRALQPALSLGLRGPRAGPAGPQPAAHGAGLVVVRDQHRTPHRRSHRTGLDGRIGRRQRRGAGLRVLLPPAHRAFPEHRQHRSSTGTGQVGLPEGTYLGYRRAFFSKPLIVSSGPDQQLGIYLLYPNTVFPTPLPLTACQLDHVRKQRHTVRSGLVQHEQRRDRCLPPVTSAGELRTTYQLRENGRDDISNQNRQAIGGPGGS